MMIPIALLIALSVIASATSAPASCTCSCVNGEPTALCTSTLDIEPICAPRVCPINPPSIRPLAPLALPPLGARNCQMEQVYNERTFRYEWRRVCE